MWKHSTSVNGSLAFVYTALLSVPAPALANNSTDALTLKLEETVKGSTLTPGVLVTIKRQGAAPWSSASGGRTIGGVKAEPGDEFRIASLTKTFVAAALIRLVEDRKLQLDQPISSLLTTSTRVQLEMAGYNTQKITVSHLLSHAAGLHDHSSAPEFYAAITADPTHQWTRFEQLALALQKPPLGPPGKIRRYSDTGYVVLGEILEQKTGRPLSEVVPALLGFDAIGLRHTYWETAVDGQLTKVPVNRVHAYQDGADTAAINAGYDLLGGGGLVSTTSDLVTFYEALFTGDVFKTEQGVSLMITAVAKKGGSFATRYAHGIYRLPGTGAATCWGHPGHWGLLAASCQTPKGRVTFAITINGAGQAADRMVDKAAKAIFEHMR